MQVVEPLASASDERISVTLDWVIVRNNAGSWAKNADWDEYLFRVRNASSEVIEVTGVAVFDSLGARLEPGARRKELVKASKKTHKRYKEASTKVRAGFGGIGLFAAGTAVTVVGATAAIAVAEASILAGGASAGSAGAIAGGIMLAGPAIAVGGMIRAGNNSKVDKEIVRRHSEFPVSLPAGEEKLLDVFFPLAPSPTHLEVTYRDLSGENILNVDLDEALRGLHLQSSSES